MYETLTHRKLRCLFVLLFSLSSLTYSPLFSQSYKAKLAGRVTSNWTGEGLVGVNVYIPSLKKGTITDANGNYEITIPLGTFVIEYSRVGLGKQEAKIDFLKDRTLNLEMSEKTLELDEFVIYSEKADANVKSLDVGKNSLSIEKINSLPSFMGEPDVIKSLMLLPGVSTVGEGSSGFNVRGGGIDQNLVLQDGGLLFNSSHVFGFFSSFNPLVVKNATLYKSGIPSSYGGRLSSLLDVELRDGSYRKYNVSGGVGLVSSKLALDGPIIKDKISVLLGGRVFYTDWLLKRVNNIDVKNSSASFQDFNAKVSYLVNDNCQISYSGYLSGDGFSFASDTTFSWQTANHVLKWNQMFSEKISLNTTALIGKYSYQIENESTVNDFRIESEIEYKSLKSSLVYKLGESNTLNFGFETLLYDFSPGERKPLSTSSPVEAKSIEKERSLESSIFLEDQIKINNKLSIRPGIRFSRFDNFGAGSDFIYGVGDSKNNANIIDTVYYDKGETIASYQGFEPRVVLNYTIDDFNSIKMSYNRTRQYLHLISNTAAATPTDFWKTSNKYIKPEIGDQYSIGFFRNWSNNAIESSVELYRKKADNILDYKDGAVLLMNENIESELIPGSSEAYGVEIFVNKKIGLTTGWISYTYSRTYRTVSGEYDDEKINLGNRYPANYDKPHDITMAINHKFSPIVEVGTNFTYSTGRPLTVPLSAYNVANLTGVANFSLRNQDRIPDYYRLDVSMTIKSKPRINRKWDYSWTFSIYNLLGRRNAYSVFFINKLGVPPKAYKLSVLGHAFPSLTFNFNF
ncbi:TonB-dependent Receptor Plug Domain [Reichenbachiella faecimaris]|uniref:TonB-dependent Receptor Plug Domain n=1 Tax=Reichenbachiella faecimaris TaxID=692418 RepID=A0A1W2GK02_REIFA|nr:TonB-dependent Receptor Plug Domain [Reichenbachiella faecimaris]